MIVQIYRACSFKLRKKANILTLHFQYNEIDAFFQVYNFQESKLTEKCRPLHVREAKFKFAIMWQITPHTVYHNNW